jgi:hypothetical protein
MPFRFHSKCKALIGILGLLPLAGCARNAQRVSEQPIAVQVASAPNSGEATMSLAPPPTPGEVQATVARVLGSDVFVIGGDKPVALMGDFNGDTYPDLAVAVKPASDKLDDINAELANWLVENPRHSYVAPRNKSTVTLPPSPKPEKVRAGETLLIVVHGYGPKGWRDPLAGQTYVLTQAAGKMLQVAKPSSELAKDFGEFPSERDVIAENLSGKRGVIYWTGAAYAWHVER